MLLTNRGVSLSLCVYKKVRVETTACFQRDQIPADVHNKAGLRGLVPCGGGPAGWQGFVLEARGWGPSATPTCRQALHSSIAETGLPMWKFTPCEPGCWQLNRWVLNSSCSEQRSRLFNLSGFKKSEIFKLLAHIVLPMPGMSGWGFFVS